MWGVGGVKKQRSAVGTALCGAFVLAHDSPHTAEMHRSGFWVPFATKRYKEFESLFRLATTTVREAVGIDCSFVAQRPRSNVQRPMSLMAQEKAFFLKNVKKYQFCCWLYRVVNQ